MAFEQIQKTPGAVALLNLCCFLAPENIPLDLFQTSDFFEKSDVFTASDVSLADALALDDAVAALRRYSLMAREGDNLRLHRLVQTVARDRMSPDLARQWVETAIEIIIKALPDWTRLHEWQDGPVMVAHMIAAADLAAEAGIETERLALLCNRTGHYLQFRAEYEKARPYYQRALDIREKVLGPDHPHTAQSLNNLGFLLQDMGDLAAARPYYQRALDIHEKVLGPDHPNTAASLNNMGGLLRAMGDLAAARPYYQRALDIREKVLGPDHPDTALSLNNIAILSYYGGDYPEASRLMRRALAIREQRLGPQHPDTVSARQSLAVIEIRLNP